MRKMKRKVAKLSGFRLSPNEEALLIKEEHERRRRLRIKQVRDQERFIAVQIRQKVKQYRNQQLEQLANELKAEWQMAQDEKTKSLEKLYLSSLKAVGKGHKQAQENEPDLKTQSRRVALDREKAEARHREALRELQQQREKERDAQTRYIKTRKKALLVEKKRAIKIAQLPPPPPSLFDFEVPKCPTVKRCDIDSSSALPCRLLEPCVNREMNTKQVSARLTAEKEVKRLEELKRESEIEKQEQLEKARLRGSHALKLVHLMQDREKLLKELEQMHIADLTRRRQALAQMPQQLFEPPYRRVELKEDQQREMEIAFEDVYADEQKIKGDVVLRLEPEPLPAPSVETQDEDLDLSIEPEGFQGEQHAKGGQKEFEMQHLKQIEVSPSVTGHSTASPSKAALMKLLTKIKKQKDHCIMSSESNCINKDVTIESGSITTEETKERTLTQSAANTIVSVEHPEMHSQNNQKAISEETIIAGNTTLFHPKEQASRIRSDVDRMKQLNDLEQQKQQQMTLLWQSEQEKRTLEANLQKAQLQQQQEMQMQETISDLERQTLQKHEQLKHSKICVSNAVLPEDEHMLTIHQYQQHLIEKNRLHKTSAEEIRKQLEEQQLEKGLPSVFTSARCTSGQNSLHQICDNKPRRLVNANQRLFVVDNKSQPNLSRPERHDFEVTDLEVLEPCIRISNAVEAEQDMSQVGLIDNESKFVEIQLGTAEIEEERLNQSMFSIALTKPVEIMSQENVSTSLVDISVQQEHLKALQQQLWNQREDILATLKLQEEFISREHELKEQMQQQTMEKNWTENQSGQLMLHEGIPAKENGEQLPLHSDKMHSLEDFTTTLSGSYSVESQSTEVVTRGSQHWRPSKPPVTKTRLGLCGLIEQHELSSIQEVESPKSDRLSMFVNRVTSSNNCCKSETKELLRSRMDPSYPSEAIKLNLSSVSTNSGQQSSSVPSTAESIQTGRLTWRDKLKLETDSLSVQASISKSPSYFPYVEDGALEICDPTSLSSSTNKIFTHYSSNNTHTFNATEKTEADQISITTLSTGSFPLSEQSAPGLMNSADDLQCAIHNIHSRQSTSPSSVCTSSFPSSFPVAQDTMKTQNHLSTSNEENYTSNENKIKNLIEKYTQDLNKLLDSGKKWHGSGNVFEISDLQFSNLFHLQHCQQDSNVVFQPLESRPNFSNSSSSSSPTSSKNLNFATIGNTSGNQHSNRATSLEMQPSTGIIISTPDSRRIDQVEENIQHSYDENSGLQSIQPVQLENTTRQESSSTDYSGESLEWEFHNKTECIPPYDPSRTGTESVDSLIMDSIKQSPCFESAIEKLRTGDGENSLEHAGSFFQLNGTLNTVNEYKISDQNGKWLESCRPEVQIVTFTNSKDPLTLNNPSVEALMLPGKNDCICSEVQQIAEQNPIMQPNTIKGTDVKLERVCEWEAQWDRSRPEVCLTQTVGLGIESNVGIMEEPELTQLTLNDSTLLDDEVGQEFPVENLTNENEKPAFSQADGEQPVIIKNTISSSQKSEVMIFEFEPSGKTLNEAVLKRKQKFLTNSAKRVQDLKRREKSGIMKSELHTRPMSLKKEQTSQFAAPSSLTAHLKMVGEVKVSTPEDRKTVEVEMRQRTLRLYNQLEEVKNKKKEVTRQTVCARNREKAKEFQKKMLEKLRANKTHR
ncbi:uro-adherence factor A [Narcine bancroftii]|uniref:uro-adherence factor A n=1 Tax=Narcine bancroftii TaxID=1343680 RepID=UPI003831B8AC